MPAGSLNFNEWNKPTRTFPNRRVTSAILGICHYGARIGYKGPRDSISIYPNHSTAEEDHDIVSTDIASELADNRLKHYENRLYLPAFYRASPLGLVDKSDGTKRRIYHLSYAAEEESSINCGIPEHYGTIAYNKFSEAVSGIQSLGKHSLLIKRDYQKRCATFLSPTSIHHS